MSEQQQAREASSNFSTKTGVWNFLLRAWQPVPTLLSTLLIFGIIGIAFIVFGIILHSINSNIIEATASNYHDRCQDQVACSYSDLIVEKDMQPPIYVFYELHNFYQNHRRYIKSKSNDQLAGSVISESTAKTNCDPVVYNNNVNNGNSSNLTQTDVAIPCGLIARSLFNDTYKLWTSNGTSIPINDTGISWPEDKGNKFKNVDLTKQWTDMENEHFIVWMRTAGLPNFRKLWGRINEVIPAGTYRVDITNNYPVAGFQGQKSFVLSTSGPFGGKNTFLEVSYFVVGGICILIALVFFIRNKMTSGRFGNVDQKDQ